MARLTSLESIQENITPSGQISGCQKPTQTSSHTGILKRAPSLKAFFKRQPQSLDSPSNAIQFEKENITQFESLVKNSDIELVPSLDSCYYQFKTTNLDALFGEEPDQQSLCSNFSFGSETSEDEESLFLVDNCHETIDDCQITSGLLTIFEGEKTNSTTEGTSIVLGWKRMFLKMASLSVKNTCEVNMLEKIATSIEDYTPVEVHIPSKRKSSSNISTLVSGFIEGHTLSSMVSTAPTTDSPSHGLKFNKYASLLMYNDLTSVLKNIEDKTNQAKDEDWSDHSNLTYRSILKNPVNQNAEQEIYRAHCCDEVDVDQFLEIFEQNEQLRYMQEPEFDRIRQQQLKSYYSQISGSTETRSEMKCSTVTGDDDENNNTFLNYINYYELAI